MLRASSRAKALLDYPNAEVQNSDGAGHLWSFGRGGTLREGGLWEIQEESCPELAVRTDLALALENEEGRLKEERL